MCNVGWALNVIKYASKGSKGAKVAKLNSRTKKAIPDCGCFVAGTLVLTDRGYKKIEEIREGDIVWAYNDTTQEYARKKVVDIFDYVRDTIYTIRIGDERINATSDHPFFIGGRWLKVSELQVGDSVVTYEGKKLVINTIEKTASQTKVYNFEVEDYHTYYVTGLNILVHNSTGPCDVPKGKEKYHGHHSFPKALGGAPDQRLTQILESAHIGQGGIHSSLAKFEGGWLRPRKGMTGGQIVQKYGIDNVVNGLRRFYSQDKWKSILPDFEEAVRFSQQVK